jgi:putative addiction module CopG family antidote
MNVLLKPELEQFITEKVTAGQFTDASDIVNEALQVLKDQEQFTPAHEAYLRREVRRGLEQLDRDQFSGMDAGQIIAEERRRMTDPREPG